MPSMLRNFPTDLVTIINDNGKKLENIDALFGRDGVTIDNVSIQIVEGDIILRNLPNGITEKYIVLNSKYVKTPSDSLIPSFYKLTVEKDNINNTKIQPNSIIYNIKDNSGKINIATTDNSIAINITQEEIQQFDTLRKIAGELENSNEILKNINEMQNSIRKPDYINRYNLFIQSIANHITIFAPFIPFLTNLLQK